MIMFLYDVQKIDCKNWLKKYKDGLKGRDK